MMNYIIDLNKDISNINKDFIIENNKDILYLSQNNN